MPLVSIFASAIKTHLWLDFYEHIESANEVDLEFVFVGNICPDYKLPDNLRFIYSSFKPAQCAQIGAIESNGEYIFHFADDYLMSDKALDSMLFMAENSNKHRTIVSPIYYKVKKEKGKTRTDNRIGCQIQYRPDGSETYLPMGSFMTKECFINHGGYDRRYCSLYYDVDFALRVQANGGKVILARDVHAYEMLGGKYSSKNRLSSNHEDSEFMAKSWSKDSKFLEMSTMGFEPYSLDVRYIAQ